MNVSTTEINTAVSILKKLDPGYLPYNLFIEFCRLYTSAIIELVPIIFKDNEIYLHLLKREESDTFWPNMWHNPGSVIRSTDQLEDVFNRLFSEELGIVKGPNKSPVFLRSIVSQTPRGNALSLIYWIELESSPHNGQSFRLDALPSDSIPEQVIYMKECVSHFLEKRNSGSL